MRTHLGLLLGTAALATAEVTPEKLRWTNEAWAEGYRKDGDSGVYGPDGPWQAVAVNLGISDDIQELIPMYPSGWSITNLDKSAWDFEGSSDATSSSVAGEEPDPWLSDEVLNYSSTALDIYDVPLWLPTASHYTIETVNRTVIAAENWTVSRADGKAKYALDVGILGMGMPGNDEKGPSGLLRQLTNDEYIPTAAWSLHMGSVAMGQAGSMVLGGYEQNRAIGDVGVFNLDVIEEGTPNIFLIDVTLGVETGASPWPNIGANYSVWKGLGGNEAGKNMTKEAGGVNGAAMVTPDPAVPYIYLPIGTCEAAAKHLPVTWNDEVGLYLWDTENTDYERIITSPAYLGFIFSDRNAKNLTIKIPFQLLNLTLDKPLVDSPTPYFPCRPHDDEYGQWQLGRAFLQGAFFGITYDRGLFYMAQAPGPDHEQSVIRSLSGDEKSIKSNPMSSFTKTWQSRWTELSITPSARRPVVNEGLSKGGIAGIVVGSVAGVGAMVGLGFFFWRQRRRQRQGDPVPTSEETTPPPKYTSPHTQETHEAPGSVAAQELDGSGMAHEAPGEEIRHELPAFPIEHQNGGDKRV